MRWGHSNALRGTWLVTIAKRCEQTARGLERVGQRKDSLLEPFADSFLSVSLLMMMSLTVPFFAPAGPFLSPQKKQQKKEMSCARLPASPFRVFVLPMKRSVVVVQQAIPFLLRSFLPSPLLPLSRRISMESLMRT